MGWYEEQVEATKQDNKTWQDKMDFAAENYDLTGSQQSIKEQKTNGTD